MLAMNFKLLYVNVEFIEILSHTLSLNFSLVFTFGYNFSLSASAIFYQQLDYHHHMRSFHILSALFVKLILRGSNKYK